MTDEQSVSLVAQLTSATPDNNAADAALGAIRPERGETAQLLRATAILELGLLGLAGAVAAIWNLPLGKRFAVSFASVGLGLVGTVPMAMFGWWVMQSNLPPFIRIRELVRRTLGPGLGCASAFQLAVIAIAAGVCEEVAFRGLLEMLLEPAGTIFAVIVASVIFGLLHAVTPTYFAMAGMFGLYFSLLTRVTSPPNLVPAIVAHTLYDFVAFLMIRRLFRQNLEEMKHFHARIAKQAPPNIPDHPIL